jgi:uncharacterized protein
MWYSIKNQLVEIHITAKPNAKKTQIISVKNERLHIAIHAQPQDGKANDELIAFLAKLFKLPKKEITLKNGESSRYKNVVVPLTVIVQQFIDSQ